MKRLHFVHLDQLHESLHPTDVPLVFVESRAEFSRLPFHKTRLVFLLSNYRHFALELEASGRTVVRVKTDEPLATALERLGATHRLSAVEPAEWEARVSLEALSRAGVLEVMPHGGWLTRPEDLDGARDRQGWRMDAFYRRVRARTGILMDQGRPVGGKFSFDAENRKPWKGEPPEPVQLEFVPDELTLEVFREVEREFGHHPGHVKLERIPQNASDAQALWAWAKSQALPMFGPFEDAMSSNARSLFHTRISAVMNVHRLLPRDVVSDVDALEIPLPSKEGFIRQVLGWREFVYQVHRATNGLRDISTSVGRVGETGAKPSSLEAHLPLPAAYWGRPSGLNCLDTVVAHVWEDAYSHHITRLMVLGNIATLLAVEPREVADWFWAAYVDSFDWVVEPNVLGMATFGTGPLFTTKPYVAGANYISKMSDYCGGCQFSPGKDCPLTRLYWNFLERNSRQFEKNPRMGPVMVGLRKRSDDEKDTDQKVFDWVNRSLAAGDVLRPADAPTQSQASLGL